MKKLLLLAILISSALFAQAQKQDKSPTKRAQSKVDKLGETLNLTDTQKEQIYALFSEKSENGKRGGKKMSEFSKEERQAFIADRKAQKAAFDAKIGEILTPEQYATFKEKNKGYGKGQREGRRNHGQGRVSSEEKLQKRVDSYTERLQLTPTQQAQVSALLQAQQANRPEKGSKKDLSEAERAEMKAAKKNVTLTFDHAYEEPILVNADEERIQQLLTNLIENSIKYGKNDGTTEVSIQDLIQNKVLIRITDNGDGIESEHIPRLFERFYRVDKSGNRKVGGSGLGLSIVKHIIEAHDEKIYVESEFGVGSEFSFTLEKAEKLS